MNRKINKQNMVKMKHGNNYIFSCKLNLEIFYSYNY